MPHALQAAAMWCRAGKPWPKIVGRATAMAGGRIGWLCGGRDGPSRTPGGPIRRSARALDRDELVVVGAASRHRAGDLVAVNLAETTGLRELARLAIGRRDRRTARRSAREASVHAIAVRIIRDDENALFRLSAHIG